MHVQIYPNLKIRKEDYLIKLHAFLNLFFENIITQMFLKICAIFNWKLFIKIKLSDILCLSLTNKEPMVLSILVGVIHFFCWGIFIARTCKYYSIWDSLKYLCVAIGTLFVLYSSYTFFINTLSSVLVHNNLILKQFVSPVISL